MLPARRSEALGRPLAYERVSFLFADPERPTRPAPGRLRYGGRCPKAGGMSRQVAQPANAAVALASPPPRSLFQRKCGCGTHTPSGAACPNCARSQFPGARSTMLSGGGPLLQRQETPPEKPPEERPREVVGPPEPESTAKLSQELLDRLEKALLPDAASKATAAAMAAGALGALAANHEKLPVPIPIPLDRITPGLSLKIGVDGPLDTPNGILFSFTYKAPAPAGAGRSTGREAYRAETARMAAEMEKLLPRQPGSAPPYPSGTIDTDAIAKSLSRSAPATPGGLQLTLPSWSFKRKSRPLLGGELKLEAPNTGEPEPAGVQRKRDVGASDDLSRREAKEGPGRRHDAVNRTGLPDRLKQGLETLSGFDLSGVRVHSDSPRPAEIGAHAFTFGQDIHVAPGQRRFLPHEGWHVVQQMQARVLPTSRLGGLALNDETRLEREADLMGAKAEAMGLGASAGRYATMLATATGESEEEEPYPEIQGSDRPLPVPASRSSGPIAQAKRVLQRAVSFVAGKPSSTLNLASRFLGGDMSAGTTSVTVNGNLSIALNPPDVKVTEDADGTAAVQIVGVPTNTGSYEMKLPTAGPWSTSTTRAAVRTLYKKLKFTVPAPCATDGKTKFTVKPAKSFVKDVTTHENLHAADIKAGFMKVVGKWDKKLEAAKTAGTTLSGPTAEVAVNQLMATMGGMPDVIARALLKETDRLAKITHQGTTLATGGPATPSNAAADPTCESSSFDVS